MEDYTGLSAIAWELFSGETPGADHDFFRRVIEESGGPALDVGCGTGRLLLAYLGAGLEVEGVDPSADMLAICRRRAEERGLAPVLYCQAMQALDLPRRYRTIFVPCGTIQLIVDREEAFEALRRCHAHLEPGGTLVLTVFNHWKGLETEQLGDWKFRAQAPLLDGTELAKHARAETCNRVEQTLTMTVRYQRLRGEQVIEEQLCPAPERWYFKHEMTLMLEKFGFRNIRVTGNYSDAEFSDPHYVMAFLARR
jgi:ubiquinone/menaquinone biosynthesis C-methylase UbiE